MRVRDEDGSTLSGAEVAATWTFPNGTRETLTATTNGSGRASFEVDSAFGWNVLDVNGVSLDGYELDTGASLLSDSTFAWR